MNPTTLMPLPTDGEKDVHNCTHIIYSTSKPWNDLRDEPLDNPDLNLFTDRASYYEGGLKRTGYAVTTETQVLLAEPLSPSLGTQGVEIITLTGAARYAVGMCVNLYTDSKYAFRVCCATGVLWKEGGFLTSAGKNVAHGAEIKALLEAIKLPSKIAVIYIKTHTNKTDRITKGNALADQAAKAAAKQILLLMALKLEYSEGELLEMGKLYDDLPEDKKKLWEKLEGDQSEGIWTLGGKPLLPKRHLLLITEWYHNKMHGGPVLP